MNFFESQDNARRRSGWLLWLFVLAVLCLVGLTQLLVMASLRFVGNNSMHWQDGFWSAFSWPMLGGIATGITVVIALASLYKMQQLRRGGAAVAELLGGRLLDRSSQQLDERKVLNVVEEMAIASGMPVPPVYVLEEASINAFAAGHDSRDVAIGITRGAIALLNRDELQGVIAHEFSHIFNGDMKLNLQLMGWLHGILFIGLVGRFLLDSTPRQSRRNSKGNGPLVLLGVGLVVIGYCGTFFGKLIKAGISRQREFLADASAVQYTRNPGGIAGALKKIGGCPLGAIISHPNAAQASHLFFGNGLSQRTSLFATHPPLEERILAIEPRWDGDFTTVDNSSVSVQKPALDPAHVHIINGEVVYTPPARTAAAAIAAASVAASIEAIGAPTAEHLATARTVLTTIPANLQQLARESWGASGIVHCLIASQQQDRQAEHLALLHQSAAGSVHSLCEQIMPEVQALPVTLRLPLVDLCLPSLKNLGTSQRNAFFTTVMAQIRVDRQVSLFEWSLYRLLRHHLDEKKAAGNPVPLAALADSCTTVLSALALATQQDTDAADAAFKAGWHLLGLPQQPCNTSALRDMTALDQAVRQLHRVQVLAKPRLLKACCAAVAEADGSYRAEAVELLRAIADTIDTPVPPVVTQAAA